MSNLSPVILPSATIGTPQPLSLRANFTWTFVGNIIYAGSSWAMLVVLAKLGTPEMVGQFALGLAVTAPVILFANLQLRAIQATDAKREYHFADYLGLRLIALVMAILAIAVLTRISNYGQDLSLIILVIGFGKAIDAISDVIYGLLQQHEQMDRIGVSLILKGILSLIMLALGLYLTHSVLWASVGWSLASVIVVVLYDIHSGARIFKNQSYKDNYPKPIFGFRVFAKLGWFALPLGFVALLTSLNANIPRYFIEGYLGRAQLGIFAALIYVMAAQNILVTAVGQAVMPKLAIYYANRRILDFCRLWLRLTGFIILIGVFCLIGAALLGRQFLSLLYGSAYAAQQNAFVWTMGAAGIANVVSLLNCAITSVRKYKVQFPITVLTATCTTLFCLWLIPLYGITGAVISVLCGLIIQACANLVVLVSALRTPAVISVE